MSFIPAPGSPGHPAAPGGGATVPLPSPPFNRVRESRYGLMLYNVNDAYVGRSLDEYGEYGEGEAALFRQLPGPGDVVLDVGANIGAHTLYFARAVAPGGMVFAFEPRRLAFQALCANMALNSIPYDFCYQAALGDAPGSVTLPTLNPYRPANFGGFELGAHGGRGEPVPVLQADRLPLDRCRLIKVDVEGMELEVLKGPAG
jgi:FkbM family methyltransferase